MPYQAYSSGKGNVAIGDYIPDSTTPKCFSGQYPGKQYVSELNYLRSPGGPTLISRETAVPKFPIIYGGCGWIPPGYSTNQTYFNISAREGFDGVYYPSPQRKADNDGGMLVVGIAASGIDPDYRATDADRKALYQSARRLVHSLLPDVTVAGITYTYDIADEIGAGHRQRRSPGYIVSQSGGVSASKRNISYVAACGENAAKYSTQQIKQYPTIFNLFGRRPTTLQYAAPMVVTPDWPMDDYPSQTVTRALPYGVYATGLGTWPTYLTEPTSGYPNTILGVGRGDWTYFGTYRGADGKRHLILDDGFAYNRGLSYDQSWLSTAMIPLSGVEHMVKQLIVPLPKVLESAYEIGEFKDLWED